MVINHMVVAGGGGWRKWGDVGQGYEVSVVNKMDTFWDLMDSVVSTVSRTVSRS